VEAPVELQRRAALAGVGLARLGLALAAIAFLVVMTLLGRARESEWYVKFEPAGLMPEAPEAIDRVEIVSPRGRLAFARSEGRWTLEQRGELPAPVRAHLDMSLRFMHVTAPVRAMAPNEYERTAPGDFGLDPPRFAVSLQRAEEPVVRARFGRPNPQEVLQYVRVDGRDALYLLPVFVGREWERVIDGASSR
jgi:hypothetical protein